MINCFWLFLHCFSFKISVDCYLTATLRNKVGFTGLFVDVKSILKQTQLEYQFNLIQPDSPPYPRMAKTIDRRGKFSLSIPWDIYFETIMNKNPQKIWELGSSYHKKTVKSKNFSLQIMSYL